MALESIASTFEMPTPVRLRAFLTLLKVAGIQLSADEYKELARNIGVQTGEYEVRRMETDLRRVQLEKEMAAGEAGKKGLYIRLEPEERKEEDAGGEGA